MRSWQQRTFGRYLPQTPLSGVCALGIVVEISTYNVVGFLGLGVCRDIPVSLPIHARRQKGSLLLLGT